MYTGDVFCDFYVEFCAVLYSNYLKPIFCTLQIPLVALEILGTGYEGEDIDEGSADSWPIFLLSMTKHHLRADRFEKIIA